MAKKPKPMPMNPTPGMPVPGCEGREPYDDEMKPDDEEDRGCKPKKKPKK